MKQFFSVVGMVCILVVFQGCENENNPLVIGHRGAMGHVAENTIASIEKALELDVDMIEIDVFKIQSGEIVVFHDDKLDRLTDATGSIEMYDYKSLQKVIVQDGHSIPTLEAVLDLIDGKVKVNIELKGVGTAKEVDRIVKSYIAKGWKTEDFIISSFKWHELEVFESLNKEVPIAVLIGENPINAIDFAKKIHAKAINPKYSTLTKENVLKIQEQGLKIYTWTVNDPEAIKQLKEWGVDGIISDFPERVHH